MEIGAQFFTVRDYCKDLESFSETLKRVSDIGYKYVQISGVCDYEPEWLNTELKKNGLKCVLTHIKTETLISNTEDVAKDHDVFNCKNIGLGWFSHNQDKENERTEDFFRIFMPVAEKLKETPWIKNPKIHFVFQPQSRAEDLREFLYSNGFVIGEETAVQEDERYYIAFDAVYTGKMREFTPADCFLGKLPKTQEAKMHIQKQLNRLQKKYTATEEAGKTDKELSEIIIRLNEFLNG